MKNKDKPRLTRIEKIQLEKKLKKGLKLTDRETRHVAKLKVVVK